MARPLAFAGMTRRGNTAYRARSTAAALAAVVLVAAGCTSAPSGANSRPAAAPNPAPTVTTATSTVQRSIPASTRSEVVTTTRLTAVTTPARTSRSAPRVTTTVTRTKPGATVTVSVAPPKTTAEPAPIDGECPYLGADVVSEITGQHHGQTQVVQLSPQPMCVFYRSDGGRMGSVRIIQASSAAAAAAVVDQHVPVAGSQPATQPGGWTGGSRTSPGQMTQDSAAMSVYAVSKGNIAVVAEENESPSLKARVMAVCAIYGLGLEAGPDPDYCAVDGQ